MRTLYTALAQQPERDFGWEKGKGNAQRLGYDPVWLARLPDCVWESAAAVGNPFALGPLHPGETVVDIGCGAGADLCIAAVLVGATGQAIGLDLTRFDRPAAERWLAPTSAALPSSPARRIS